MTTAKMTGRCAFCGKKREEEEDLGGRKSTWRIVNGRETCSEACERRQRARDAEPAPERDHGLDDLRGHDRELRSPGEHLAIAARETELVIKFLREQASQAGKDGHRFVRSVLLGLAIEVEEGEHLVDLTCDSNVARPGEEFSSCDAPATRFYDHGGSVCCFCDAHDSPCGERLTRTDALRIEVARVRATSTLMITSNMPRELAQPVDEETGQTATETPICAEFGVAAGDDDASCDHVFRSDLERVSSAPCLRGCSVFARRDPGSEILHFLGTRRTGSQAGDMRGVWGRVPPPCVGRAELAPERDRERGPASDDQVAVTIHVDRIRDEVWTGLAPEKRARAGRVADDFPIAPNVWCRGCGSTKLTRHTTGVCDDCTTRVLVELRREHRARTCSHHAGHSLSPNSLYPCSRFPDRCWGAGSHLSGSAETCPSLAARPRGGA